MWLAEGREVTALARLTDTLRFARTAARIGLAYRWARSEINRFALDGVPYLVHRISQLERRTMNTLPQFNGGQR